MDINQIIKEEVSSYIPELKARELGDAHYDKAYQIAKSRNFQIEFVKALRSGNINDGSKFKNWQLTDASTDSNDSDTDQYAYNIDYKFEFTYIYDGMEIPLELDIQGPVSFQKTPGSEGDYLNPPDHGENENFDYRELNIILWYDGEEIDLNWILNNPQIIHDIVKKNFSTYFDE